MKTTKAEPRIVVDWTACDGRGLVPNCLPELCQPRRVGVPTDSGTDCARTTSRSCRASNRGLPKARAAARQLRNEVNRTLSVVHSRGDTSRGNAPLRCRGQVTVIRAPPHSESPTVHRPCVERTTASAMARPRPAPSLPVSSTR